MMETGNECQVSAYLLLLSNVAIVVGCTEVLFQPSFSLCCSTCCLRNMRRTTRWLRNGVGDQSTPSTTERDSAQTERVLTRLVVHSPSRRQPSVSSQKRENSVAHTHPCIDRVILCCLLSRYTHNSSWSTLGLHFEHLSSFSSPLFLFTSFSVPSFCLLFFSLLFLLKRGSPVALSTGSGIVMASDSAARATCTTCTC